MVQERVPGFAGGGLLISQKVEGWGLPAFWQSRLQGHSWHSMRLVAAAVQVVAVSEHWLLAASLDSRGLAHTALNALLSQDAADA